MVKCPKCGAEIKYIPLRFGGYTAIVDLGTIEVYTDSGRKVEGHAIHKCPAEVSALDDYQKYNGLFSPERKQAW